jgi:methionyl-tRNA formyltransferase
MPIIHKSPYSLVFFGSFQHYSTIVLETLLKDPRYQIKAVITTPPRPSGRDQNLKKTDTHLFSQKNNIPVFTPQTLNSPPPFSSPDFFVVAGYGQKLPPSWLSFPRFMAINFHPSLLPSYRGPFPIEWALLNQEKQIGLSLVKMNRNFDQGEIIIQKTIPVKKNDDRQTLYQEAYERGAKLLCSTLSLVAQNKIKLTAQGKKSSQAPRLGRQDGFISWQTFKNSLSLGNKKEKKEIETKFRALHPWPGIWTLTDQNKRLKIIQLKPQLIVQLEGKNPTPLNEIKNQII